MHEHHHVQWSMTKHYYLFHKHWMHHKDKQKRAQKCSSLVSTYMIKIYMIFQSKVTWARESETLILPPTLGHCHLLLQLCLPKFCTCFLSLEIRWSCYYQYNFRIKLLKAQALQACSLLTIATSDLSLSGRHLASLLLAANRDPSGCGLHVDCHFPFPPSWL